MKPCQRAGLVTGVFTAVTAAVTANVPALRELAFALVRTLTRADIDGDPLLDVSVLGRLGVAVVLAAGTGALNWLVRCAQATSDRLVGRLARSRWVTRVLGGGITYDDGAGR